MKQRFPILFLLLFSLFSCGDEEPRYTVPRSLVSFTLNISLQDRELAPGGGTKSFTSARIGTDRMGFGGLLVVNGGDLSGQGLPILYAYDLACPKEDSGGSLVQPKSGGVSAVCPTCKSEYSIIIGTGHVMSGPSKEPLQRYRIGPTNGNGAYRVVN